MTTAPGGEKPEGTRERIYRQVREIPPGDVITYGELALLCGTRPIIVGKAMAGCPSDVPWHRVVGAGGELRIARRGAAYAEEQRRRLAAEGVGFLPDGRVDIARHGAISGVSED